MRPILLCYNAFGCRARRDLRACHAPATTAPPKHAGLPGRRGVDTPAQKLHLHGGTHADRHEFAWQTCCVSMHISPRRSDLADPDGIKASLWSYRPGPDTTLWTAHLLIHQALIVTHIEFEAEQYDREAEYRLQLAGMLRMCRTARSSRRGRARWPVSRRTKPTFKRCSVPIGSALACN